MMPSLSNRADLVERMDAPDCCEVQLLRTVSQFASINRLVSRYKSILRRHVLADMAQDPDRDYHLLDMGAGGCDIDAWLCAAARRRGLRLRVTACDLDPRIVRFAQRQRAGTPGLDIQQRNVLTDPIDDTVDYVFANHFLHHLSEQEIVAVLRRWAPCVRRRLVFSDLSRSAAAYLGFALLSRCYRKSFAREDGLISIRRGFRAGELQSLAASALPDHRIAVHVLAGSRLVLTIQPCA